MAFFKEELVQVKAFIFDVDGVLSQSTLTIGSDGNPLRTSSIKDGYAIVNAIKKGYKIGVITGGNTDEVRLRCKKLGIKDIYMGASDKIACLDDFLLKNDLVDADVMYMGDDIPDYTVMSRIGLPVCPHDAVDEIKRISKYISERNGGEGCVRDVIEQVMRVHGNWMDEKALHWSSF